MMRQKDMEQALLLNHRQFVNGLEKSISILENDIHEAEGMDIICTDEWCKATENFIDELHKDIYAISEPRWADTEDSARISRLRKRVKELYVHYKSAQA